MNKARPYVYRCEHKDTKEFYIGYRYANVYPFSQDFGIHYFTSSEIIKKTFEDYTYELLSEYNHHLMAYEVEQRLLYEFRDDPLLINGNNFRRRNLLPLELKPAKPNIPYKKILPDNGPRKRSSPIPKGVKKSRRRKRRLLNKQKSQPAQMVL